MKSFEELKEKYVFPKERPNAPDLGDGNAYHAENMFRHILKKDFKLALEIGVLHGGSTFHILNFCPEANTIVMDNWSMQLHPGYNSRDVFVNKLWDYKDRISIIDGDSKDGLKILSQYDINPEVIYIDGLHAYTQVSYEMETCHNLFPKMIMCGDNFRMDDDIDKKMGGVEKAVRDFLNKHRQHNFRFEVYEDGHLGSWCVSPKKTRTSKGPKIKYK